MDSFALFSSKPFVISQFPDSATAVNAVKSDFMPHVGGLIIALTAVVAAAVLLRSLASNK